MTFQMDLSPDEIRTAAKAIRSRHDRFIKGATPQQLKSTYKQAHCSCLKDRETLLRICEQLIRTEDILSS